MTLPLAPQYIWVSADEYLNRILAREYVDNGPASPIRSVQATLTPHINTWANGQMLTMHPSGSFMKGTAVLSGTDIDFFISLSQSTTESLQQIHDTLFQEIVRVGYSPKRQNVSLNIKVGSYSVDLVPAGAAERRHARPQHHQSKDRNLDQDERACTYQYGPRRRPSSGNETLEAVAKPEGARFSIVLSGACRHQGP